MPIGNEHSGGGGGAGSPDSADQIKAKLETLVGSNRLDASAIQNLDIGASSLLAKIKEVADAEGLAHGNAFSESGTNDILAVLGVDATIATGDRVLPSYYNSGGNIAFFGGSGDDPTDATNAIIEIVIPNEYFTTSQELRITAKTSSASGTRKIWAYAGDATASGTELNVTRGSATNATSAQRTVYFDISSNSADIHIYVSKQVILDIALPNKSGRWGALFTATKLAEAVKFAEVSLDVSHGNTLSPADSNTALISMGVGAYFRTTNDRALPNVYISGDTYGIYGGDRTADETTDGRACEVVIPSRNLQHDMVIEVMRESASSGAAGSRMVAYSGDPTSGGTKLVPISGTEAWTNSSTQATVAWNVSTTPTAGGSVLEDLHICIMGQSVFALDLYKVAKHSLIDVDLKELRGGDKPAEFDNLTTYAKGDVVFYTPSDSSFEAKFATGPDSWDAANWTPVSILNNAKRILGVEDENVSLQDQIDIIRSGEASDYPDYDSLTTYNIGDKVTEPYNGVHAICIEDGVTGSFDDTKWDELSIENNAKPATIRDRLERLTGTDRLDIEAIKHLDAQQLVYVSNMGDDANSGLSELTPVRTIARSIAVSHTLPSSSDRAIVCTDSSIFTENMPMPNGVSVFMPMAEITGNFTTQTDSFDIYVMRQLSGNVMLGRGSFFKVELFFGEIDLAAGIDQSVVVEINKYSLGNLKVPTTAEGHLKVKVDLSHTGFQFITNSSPIEASGWIGHAFFGANLYGDAPTDGLTYGRKDNAWEAITTGGGGSGHEVVTKTLNPANEWLDLVTWDAQSPVVLGGAAAHIIIYGVAPAHGFVLECNVKMFATRGTSQWDGTINILSRVAEYPVASVPAKYRILRDSTTVGDAIRFQVLIGVDFDINWTMVNNFPVPYGSDATFDILNYTDTLTQDVLEEVDVTKWEALGINSGTTDGMTAKSIHDLDTACSIDFSKSTVDIYAGDQIVGQFENDGVSFTGGEYGSWSVGVSDPFAAALTYPVITEDTNPINPVVLTITDTSTGSGIWQRFEYSALGNYCVSPEDADAQLTFNYQGVDTNTSIKTKLRIYSIFGATWEARLPDGTVVGSIVQTGGSKLYENEFSFDVTEEMRDSGEANITLNHVAGGFANGDAIFEWSFDVVSTEPMRDANVVMQVDSNYRGVMLPRVSGNITTAAVNPAGAIALDKQRGNAPIWSNGLGWNAIKTSNFQTERSLVDTGYFSQVDDGQLDTFGWISHSDVTLPVQTVDGYGGFSRLLHINDTSSGTVSGAIRSLTTAETVVMSDNGFRWDFDWLPESGKIYHYIEFNGDFHGGRGRFLMAFDHTGSQVNVSNGSDAQTALAPVSQMLKVACFLAPASTDLQVYIDGVHAFTFPYKTGAGDNVNRIHHTSGTSGGTGMSGYLLASNITTLTPVDYFPTEAEMASYLELFIPNINTPSTVTVPRGIQPLGTEFKVVNGSSLVCRVQGYSDDAQAFGGKSHYDIQPFTHVTFIQTATPFGSYWTIDGDVTHHAIFTVNSAHALVKRSGNYHGDITITSVATGHFRAALDGVLLPASTPMSVTINAGVDGWKKNACVDVDLGQVNVHTGDVPSDSVENVAVTVRVDW